MWCFFVTCSNTAVVKLAERRHITPYLLPVVVFQYLSLALAIPPAVFSAACRLFTLVGGATRRNPVLYSPRLLSCGARCTALARRCLSDDLVRDKELRGLEVLLCDTCM